MNAKVLQKSFCLSVVNVEASEEGYFVHFDILKHEYSESTYGSFMAIAKANKQLMNCTLNAKIGSGFFLYYSLPPGIYPGAEINFS